MPARKLKNYERTPDKGGSRANFTYYGVGGNLRTRAQTQQDQDLNQHHGYTHQDAVRFKRELDEALERIQVVEGANHRLGLLLDSMPASEEQHLPSTGNLGF